METSRRILKAFLLATLGIAVVEILLGRFGPRTGLPALFLIGTARAIEICWILSSLFLFGVGRREIFLPEAGMGRGLRRGLLWSAAFGMLALAVFALLWWSGRDPLRLLGIGPTSPRADPWLYLAVACMIGPLAEEL